MKIVLGTKMEFCIHNNTVVMLYLYRFAHSLFSTERVLSSEGGEEITEEARSH